jgi:hypothetical protein
MNPFDETVDALVMNCRFKIQIDFNIDPDFVLFVETNDLEAEILTMNAYFRTNLNIRKLNGAF